MQTIATTETLKGTVRAYPGCRIAFNLTSNETNNALAVMDMRMTPGSEPPRHIHLWEDETIMVHEGSITFFIGDDITQAKAGEMVFIPRTVPHNFIVTSDLAVCTLIVTPGGLENFFKTATFPYDSDNIPAAERPPTREEMEIMNTNAERFGIRFV